MWEGSCVFISIASVCFHVCVIGDCLLCFEIHRIELPAEIWELWICLYVCILYDVICIVCTVVYVKWTWRMSAKQSTGVPGVMYCVLWELQPSFYKRKLLIKSNCQWYWSLTIGKKSAVNKLNTYYIFVYRLLKVPPWLFDSHLFKWHQPVDLCLNSVLMNQENTKTHKP